MYVYTLNNRLKKTQLFDLYSSFIWAERFNGIGDFEFRIPTSPRARTLLREDVMLGIDESLRVMVIENVTESTNADGQMEMRITGRGLEKILLERPLLSNAPKYTVSGMTPGAAIRKMFDDICGPASARVEERFPYYDSGGLYPSDTIPEPTATIDLEVDATDLWTGMSTVAEMYGFGLRFYTNTGGFTSPKTYFDVYTGRDLTAAGGAPNPLVFSVELETLQSPRSLSTSESYRNVAIVRGGGLEREFIAPGLTNAPTYFDRRVLVIMYDDLDPDGVLTVPQKEALMETKAMYELAKRKRARLFDGEISQFSPYVYGVDYQLGDLVEFRASNGDVSTMRISEQIFVMDNNGFRSYPTLEIHSFSDAGTWGAMQGQEWDDMTTETWGSMP